MEVRPINAVNLKKYIRGLDVSLPYDEQDKEDVIKQVCCIIDNWPTLPQTSNELLPGWVSVEERLPEDEARQYIEDDLDGIGYLYPCLLTYKSPNTERIHVVRFYYDIIQKWFVNNGEELCEKGRCIAWMPLPAPPTKEE